jgi:hypothetical protein
MFAPVKNGGIILLLMRGRRAIRLLYQSYEKTWKPALQGEIWSYHFLRSP